MILVVALEWCYQIYEQSVRGSSGIMTEKVQNTKTQICKNKQHKVYYNSICAKKQRSHNPVRGKYDFTMLVEKHNPGVLD